MSGLPLIYSQRLARFAVTGVGSTLVHTGVALLLINVMARTPPLANGVAFCVATIFSYVVNTRWSFSAPLEGQNFRRFITVAAVGFLLAVALAWVAEAVGWPPIAGIGLVVCVVPIVSFILHSVWTYR
jgi:putative flippase GtrA